MNLKDTPYWQIFNDIWDLLKKYMPSKNSDEYWDSVVNEADALYEKYKNKPEGKFTRGLIFEVICELERIYKCGKEESNK